LKADEVIVAAQDFWWASGRVLGPPNLETVFSYQSAFHIPGDFSVTFYFHLQTLVFQTLEFRELVRFITRKSPQSRYSSSPNSFVGSIYDDRLFTESQGRILEKLEWDLLFRLETVGNKFKTHFGGGELSSHLERMFSLSSSLLWARLNRLLRILLQAPSIIEGLISQEGLETGASVVEWLSGRSGGSCFVPLDTLESPEDYLDSLTNLISGAGKKYLDGTYPLVVHLTY
jgi:hypothetical protein